MIREEWRPVVGWPKYQISSRGRVRGNGWKLRIFKIDGYPSFNVSDFPRRRSLRVHREALRTFKGPSPADKPEARHLDGNKANCALDNLEWGSRLENEGDKERHGTKMRGERHWRSVLTRADVDFIRKVTIAPAMLADHFGVCLRTIWCVKLHETWD